MASFESSSGAEALLGLARSSGPRLTVQVGSETDVGGGSENQDDYFVCSVGNESDPITVLCVLDGHGREVGKVAANSAKDALIEFFHASYVKLRDKPYETLVEAHEVAHFKIKEAFKRTLVERGFDVREAEGGFLEKRRKDAVNSNWGCVHGGSACSIIALIGTKCYIANVGDSSGILCTEKAVLTPESLVGLGDAATGTRGNGSGTGNGDGAMDVDGTGGASDTLIITAEHSPESVEEFLRLRSSRPRQTDANYPALVVVYDSPTQDKTLCPPVFSLDAAGNPRVTSNGRYYKNVRKEWASLVSTPPTADYQDALAFTRSLGDLHLSTYGVTHLPEVACIELATILGGGMQAAPVGARKGTRGAGAGSAEQTQLLCIVLATDGVWDNWVYDDVQKFVMDSSCVQAVLENGEGGQRVTQSFMQRNAVYARRNFGRQADNATGIICYLTNDSTLFASSPGGATGAATATHP